MEQKNKGDANLQIHQIHPNNTNIKTAKGFSPLLLYEIVSTLQQLRVFMTKEAENATFHCLAEAQRIIECLCSFGLLFPGIHRVCSKPAVHRPFDIWFSQLLRQVVEKPFILAPHLQIKTISSPGKPKFDAFFLSRNQSFPIAEAISRFLDCYPRFFFVGSVKIISGSRALTLKRILASRL